MSKKAAEGKGKRALQVGAVLLGLATAAAVFFLLRPPCLVLESTGFYCGACGFTRMVEELLQGHWAGAFRQNPYMFFVLPLTCLWLLGEAVRYVAGKPPLWKRRWAAVLWGCVLGAGLVFTVLRNLPGFTFLQPV